MSGTSYREAAPGQIRARECLCVHAEEQEEVARDREVWESLLTLLTLQAKPG